MRLIITCGCGDTTQFAKDAFRIMYPKEKLPEVVELNKETRPMIRLFLSALAVEAVVDKFMDTKFAIAVEVRYKMNADIMGGEAYEDMDIYIDDLIKGHVLEL